MKTLPSALAVIGAMLQLALPIGLVSSQVLLHRSVSRFDLSHLDDVGSVSSAIRATTASMGTAMDHFWIGFGIALLGLGLFIIALTRLRFRHRWAFWFASVYGGFLVFVFPIGTPFGLFLLIYSLIHRVEFGVRPPTYQPT